MNVLFCGYRDWSKNIYNALKQSEDISFCGSSEERSDMTPSDFDLVFFVGWSEIIGADWINRTECICLHPSMLPEYRGGSPIQNQIIEGEKWSGVTLFKMNEELDSGDIIDQAPFSLDGDLIDIFSRIETLGVALIKKTLTCGEIKYSPQDHSKASFFKRRTPKMSEIKVDDFKNFTAEELHNKIRSLQDPYPNAFISCKHSTKLFLQKSRIK